MTIQTQLGGALMEGLNKLRNQNGTFDIADLGALFLQLSSSLPVGSVQDLSLQEEIRRMADFIDQAKNEIIATGGNATGDATLHLDAIIKGTEEAGHTIMDAVDAVQKAAEKIEGAAQQEIFAATTRIYEACTFQDLTSQRVRKVIKILEEIDSRIHNMVKLFDVNAAAKKPGVAKVDTRTEDEKLLNGPQLPGQAPTQADVDALFANVKKSN